AQDRVAEAECTGQVIEDLLVALDVHQNIVRLVHFRDGIGQLAPTPVFQAMHAAFTGGDHALVALDHRGHLLALIGMHEKYDLVMPHDSSSRIMSRPSRGAARCGKEIVPSFPRGREGYTIGGWGASYRSRPRGTRRVPRPHGPDGDRMDRCLTAS